MSSKPKRHPFEARPNRTLLALMFPVLLSLIAEPLTGLVDTAFVAQLGTAPLAGLGVATMALSTMFWAFNFLNVGTQTQISQAEGAGHAEDSRKIISLALIVGFGVSLGVMAVFYPFAVPIAGLLGGSGEVAEAAAAYIRVRALGAPAVFATLICFGALRGAQDMRTPSIVAVAVNVLNIALDPIFIFGWGPVPALGVTGAAIASTLSQVIGAVWILAVVLRRFGFEWHLDGNDLLGLFAIGGNLFARSGLLTLYLILATRVANQVGPEAGAAHQVIRQVYIFTALALDAFAVSAQSLVGYFVGAGKVTQARRAANVSMWWSLGTGALLTAAMLGLTDLTIAIMVPAAAVAVFTPAWVLSALAQPLNALAFATDGVHLGTADYAYLRNGMILATVTCGVALFLVPQGAANAFTWVWGITVVWVLIRAAWGLWRVYRTGDAAPLSPVTA